ncbi:diacylglycerol kinase family protein [Oscillibacter sp.]|uniref:diacylglycerol/lipid kinase family protein n=1 Tax=Oscillibacter sp. TaxID=1945593 RepID=UPI002637CC83|nr:diacylglycerol kinase family protein [Oscillibacter sp.]MDD3346206.1 diacylglycerol kinase family protein [Oscillibacter sp.]
MKHVFVINPRAGKRDQTTRIYDMANRLRTQHALECACMLTDRKGGAAEMVRKLAERGEALRIYACGGDGTAFEVANGIAGFPNAAMTCIPTGTGNDFLKNFGPDLVKFSDAENLWDGDVFPLDLIECNGHLCLTIACTGIDARVADSVHQFSRWPLLSGRGSYLCSVAANFLFRPIGRQWTVTLDGQTEEDAFALVSVCNGRYYGGGSTPVPEARLDDGVLRTILVKNVGKAAFARLFGAYSAGRYRELPPELIRVSTAREITIRGEEPFVTCLDGECFHWQEARLRLSDRRLNFFGPRGCDPNATAR